MNQDNDNPRPEDGDIRVSRLYRGLASERPPQMLDQAVLREAASDAASKSWRANWFRPFAFVAMVGLSLAVVLEISNTPQFEAPAGGVPVGAESLPPPAKSDVRPQAPIAGDNTAYRQQKNSVADTPATTIQTESFEREDVKAGAVASPEPVQEVRAAGRIGAQTEPPRTNELEEAAAVATTRMREMGSAKTSQPATAPSRLLTSELADTDSAAAPDACNEEVRSAAESWWRCIAELRENGLASTADDEFELFREAYPDFMPAN